MNTLGLSADVAARLVAAVVLGAAIGLQREVDDQPAGLRTHLSVALGAALFGLVSTVGFEEFEQSRSSTNLTIDVSRVASQVVVGIGFLGAGMIFRRGNDIRNLTTAASLWVTAAVGLAAGVGDLGIAALTAALLLLALGVLKMPRNWVRRRLTRKARLVRVRVAPSADLAEIRRCLDTLDEVRTETVGVDKRDGSVEYRVRLEGEPGVDPSTRLDPLLVRDDVVAVHPADGGD